MQTFTKIIGIDVAKDTLAVSIYNGMSHKMTEIKYTQKEIKKIKILGSYNRHLAFINKEVSRLEKHLDELLEKSFSKEYALLKSIPSIGLKTSAMIIAVFDSFKTFQNAKQVCSFAGIAPNPYQSGTSVRGRGRISKRGNPLARKIIYMGALSAITHNPLVRAQYQRLIENGKPKMLAIVAAANKLLRIAFGVLKSGITFDAKYMQVRI